MREKFPHLSLTITIVALLLLLLSGLIFYLPALRIFIQGDDFLLLWNIQIPVSIFLMPFTGWTLPIAGRYGYGEAWYAFALFKLFGLNIPIFNLAGIFIKLIVIVSVYTFSMTLTKIKTLSLMAAILVTFITTGVDSTLSLSLHFSSGLAAFLLFGSSLMFKSFENKSIKTWLIGASIIIIGAFLMLPRAFGIVLLPLWTIFRYNLIPKTLRVHSILGSLTPLVILAILVWIVPGGKDLAFSNTVTGFGQIIQQTFSGIDEIPRAFFVSLGFSLLPSSVYFSFAQFLGTNFFKMSDLSNSAISSLLFPWSILLWTALYALFILPLIQKRKSISFLDVLGYLSGTLWSILLFILFINNHPIFYGREVVATVLGMDILFLMIFLGLQYLFIETKIGSMLLICAISIPTFYFPTWIHDPLHVSDSSFRYLTLSSPFVAIGLACLIYILYLHGKYFLSIRKIIKGQFLIITAVLIFTYILITNIQQTSTVMAQEIKNRQPQVFLSNWDFVRSKVDFGKTPLIVIIWTDGDIFDIKREFFKDEGLALISQRPWDAKLPTQAKLNFNFKDSMEQICNWKTNGIIFNPSNLYLFKMNKNLTMETQFEEGRKKLETWDKYCSDPTKVGIEAGEPLPQTGL